MDRYLLFYPYLNNCTSKGKLLKTVRDLSSYAFNESDYQTIEAKLNNTTRAKSSKVFYKERSAEKGKREEHIDIVEVPANDGEHAVSIQNDGDILFLPHHEWLLSEGLTSDNKAFLVSGYTATWCWPVKFTFLARIIWCVWFQLFLTDIICDLSLQTEQKKLLRFQPATSRLGVTFLIMAQIRSC